MQTKRPGLNIRQSGGEERENSLGRNAALGLFVSAPFSQALLCNSAATFARHKLNFYTLRAMIMENSWRRESPRESRAESHFYPFAARNDNRAQELSFRGDNDHRDLEADTLFSFFTSRSLCDAKRLFTHTG